MNVLIRRNLKLYFRDRGAVFFSLLAVLIIIALYAVFLGGVWLPDSMQDLPGAGALMNSWLVAGLLAVASVTTTMGAFGVMIDDRVRKIDRDFLASPVPKSSIAGGYLGSAFLIGTIMSFVTVLAGEVYIVLSGGEWLSAPAFWKAAALVLLAALTNTSIVCFLVSFFKTQNAFGTASTIIGTLVGFLTGIYLPIGSLPSSVQTVVKAFPVSYAAALFRQVLMDAPMKAAFEGLPAQYPEAFRTYMGVDFQWNGHAVTPLASVAILLGTAAVFYGLSILNLSRRRSG
jgi:multidrug/hemolysin transport system permease protein